MKKTIVFIMAIALIFLGGYSTSYSFDSGSTGVDGALNPTTDTEVQLPADGKLNYTTVNIPVGVTVTFKRNAANTPVYSSCHRRCNNCRDDHCERYRWE